MLDSATDSSHRFVLAEDAPYLRNLQSLWATDPKLAAAIEAFDNQPSYPCEASRSGQPTMRAQTSDGRDLYLHSRHEPLKEAEQLLGDINPRETFVFFLHGLGLGYHAELLFERISKESILCVMEPDLVLLRTAMEQRDLSKLIESGRLLFFTTLDKSDLFVRMLNYNGLLILGTASITLSAAATLSPEFHKQMAAWIEQLRSFGQTSLNTLILNGRRTAENITKNVGWYAASPGIERLHNRYRGSPAVIVSAGPSLRKNKHLLPEAVGKAVIIAVQTTLQPLLEMGIEPNFVTSLDYHDICTRFFEKLPPMLRTELVAEPKASDRIFQLHPGPLTVLGNSYADSLLAEMSEKKVRLSAGATVAHLAYYLAEHLGCDPIIFVGQDLAFSDGLCYTPGTSYEDVWRPELSEFSTVEMKQWEQIVRDRPILRQIPDQQGRMIYTEERLFTYLQQFERDFGRTKTRIIDATEGGALKRGSVAMTLRTVLEQFCTADLPAIADDHPGLQWHRIGQAVDCLIERRRQAGEIEDIARKTLPLLEQVRDHLDDQPRVNRLIAKIDKLRRHMDQLGSCYELIVELTQLTEMQRFENDRKIAAEQSKGTDLQRRQVMRDVANVQGVIDAAGEFQTLMTQVIDRLTAEHRIDLRRKEAA
jgi:hypothetical protein